MFNMGVHGENKMLPWKNIWLGERFGLGKIFGLGGKIWLEKRFGWGKIRLGGKGLAGGKIWLGIGFG